MLRWREPRRTRTSRHSCHTSKMCLVDRKRKPSEKSPPCFHSTFANKKFPWLACLAIAMILRLVQKRFSRPCETKKDGILLVFKRGNWRFFFSLVNTSKTLCRLHLIVLVDLIMFTHANRFANYSHMLFFPSSILPPTSPTQTISRSQYFDISVSCMLRYHQWRYRYVYARQRGARHHAAVPHGWRHILVLPMHVNERPH